MDLTERLPIIPHESAGLDCCCYILAETRGVDTELKCNKCGATVGVINTILEDLLSLFGPSTRG